MIALLLAVFLFTSVACGVVAYAAYTHRGRPLPVTPQLNDRVDRWHDSVTSRVGGPLENTAVSGALISHSVVMSPEQDIAGRHWFLRAERRVLAMLPVSARRRIEARLPGLVRSLEPVEVEARVGSGVVV